jgi:hypothetical protein
MSSGDQHTTGIIDEAVLTAAGVADLAFDALRRVLTPLGDLVQRSDLGELTHDGHADLRRRGRLALDRRLPRSEPPVLEGLARRAAAARATSAEAVAPRVGLTTRGARALDRCLPRSEPPVLEGLARRAAAARAPSADAVSPHRDIKTRGGLVLDRWLPSSEPPVLEGLARRAAAARAANTDA